MNESNTDWPSGLPPAHKHNWKFPSVASIASADPEISRFWRLLTDVSPDRRRVQDLATGLKRFAPPLTMAGAGFWRQFSQGKRKSGHQGYQVYLAEEVSMVASGTALGADDWCVLVISSFRFLIQTTF